MTKHDDCLGPSGPVSKSTGPPGPPAFFQGKSFKVGQMVTFKYRELTDDGIPKEARFWRERGEECS